MTWNLGFRASYRVQMFLLTGQLGGIKGLF